MRECDSTLHSAGPIAGAQGKNSSEAVRLGCVKQQSPKPTLTLLDEALPDLLKQCADLKAVVLNTGVVVERWGSCVLSRYTGFFLLFHLDHVGTYV